MRFIVLSLSAPQADTLEDAIQTFLPAGQRPHVTHGGRVQIHPQQLPALVAATQSYRREICDDRTTRALVAQLQKVGARA